MLSHEAHLGSMNLQNGGAELKAFFTELVKKDIKEAVTLLNEESLKFGHLFVLKHIIEENNILGYLSLRNKIALSITDEILTGRKSMPLNEFSAAAYVQETRSALKWILVTGFIHDGLNNDFDKVLDGCAAFSVKVYEDKTVLPVIAEAIFWRNRKGFYYNDLVWAFFESRYPYGLILIATRLHSMNTEDVELAHRLLEFVPAANMARGIDKEKQYLSVLQWIEENSPFLYFTGESFQQSGNPKPYRVVLEAKYLCKAVSVDNGITIVPLTDKERKLLTVFKDLDDRTRVMLSEYSLRLHNNNIYLWNEWMRRPVSEQAMIAWLWMGGA